jgi:phage-related protein
MEEARAKAEALGLVVGQQSLNQTLAYKSAMNDVHEVLEGAFNVIGQIIMPLLTTFGEWLGNEGPNVVNTLRAAMTQLCAVFRSIGAIVSGLWDVISTVFSSIFSIFVALWDAVNGYFMPIGGVIKETFAGPPLTAMELFKNVVAEIEVAFMAVSLAIKAAANVIAGILEIPAAAIVSWANVFERAFHLDWAGVNAAWAAGGSAIEADFAAQPRNLRGCAAGSKVRRTAALRSPRHDSFSLSYPSVYIGTSNLRLLQRWIFRLI